MDKLIDLKFWETTVESGQGWLESYVFAWANLIQILVVLVLFSLAMLIAPRLRRILEQQSQRRTLEKLTARVVKVTAPITLPATWLMLQWIALLVASHVQWPHDLLRITVSLLTAWVVIRLTTGLVRDPGWARVVAMVAWTVAALNIVGLLDDTIELLDKLAFSAGDMRVSALLVLKGVLALGMLLWVAGVASNLLERRITESQNLTPTVQVLFVKLLKIVLTAIAVVVALNVVGIELTAFAFLAGAIGVGIGFGLQKIVSNLVSGVIILLDKSIKPGDVISVGETYGWIKSLGARYVSVVTRDGMEWLIPNEDLITQQVVNWSYSNDTVRLKIPLGISYSSDPRRAIELCFEAAAETPRIISDPKTNVLLKGFGDSSIDLEIRVWIRDPQNGVSNVKSEILLRVWDKFAANNIEIPFPQRDIHLIPPTDTVED
ncbi:MAG: mechanosensitive ion channel protein [marine bacterium B5-7]|nr:MAG: mechanosensitive ion channel protein [marine bacterium B5-7]